jgi:hypothetical protein
MTAATTARALLAVPLLDALIEELTAPLSRGAAWRRLTDDRRT